MITPFFEALASLVQLHPKARPSSYGIQVQRNLSYGRGHPYRNLDIWKPSQVGSSPLPWVLLVHGGGFRILSKDTHWLIALMFARAGLAVCSINYRLSSQGPFPAGLEDTCLAYQWLVQNSQQLGLDPDRIAFAGESAGANLITALALAASHPFELGAARSVYDQSVAPKCILPICGLLETTNPERYTEDSATMWLFRKRIQVVCEEYLANKEGMYTQLASPLVFLESSETTSRPFPPAYITVGTKDPIAEDSYRMARALNRRGITYQLDVYRGEPHAFHALVWREAAKQCWQAQFTFLSEYLGPLNAENLNIW